MTYSSDQRALVQNLFLLGLVWLSLFVLSFAQPKNLLVDDLGQLDLETAIPKTIGDWQLVELQSRAIINPRQQQIIDQIYTEVIERVYVNSKGYRVMFTVAYGKDQSDRLALHHPDVCYPAQGFKISDMKSEKVQVSAESYVILERMLAKYESRTEPVSYWSTMGERVPQSRLDRKIIQAEYALDGYVPDGMLIRVSSIDRNSEEAYDFHDGFIGSFFKSLDPLVHSRFFGVNL